MRKQFLSFSPISSPTPNKLEKAKINVKPEEDNPHDILFYTQQLETLQKERKKRLSLTGRVERVVSIQSVSSSNPNGSSRTNTSPDQKRGSNKKKTTVKPLSKNKMPKQRYRKCEQFLFTQTNFDHSNFLEQLEVIEKKRILKEFRIVGCALTDDQLSLLCNAIATNTSIE